MNEKLLAKIIAFIILLVITIILMVAEWRIFKKAGEKGYKAIIPFYNVYLSHEIVGMGPVWFIIEMFLWVGEMVSSFVKFNPVFELIFLLMTFVFTIISEVIHATKMCKCFGKGRGFKIGTVLFPGIFLPIIAFGKSTYKKLN